MVITTEVFKVMQLQPDAAMAKSARCEVHDCWLMSIIGCRIKLKQVFLCWHRVLKYMPAVRTAIGIPNPWITIVVVVRLTPELGRLLADRTGLHNSRPIVHALQARRKRNRFFSSVKVKEDSRDR